MNVIVSKISADTLTRYYDFDNCYANRKKSSFILMELWQFSLICFLPLPCWNQRKSPLLEAEEMKHIVLALERPLICFLPLPYWNQRKSPLLEVEEMKHIVLERQRTRKFAHYVLAYCYCIACIIKYKEHTK